MLDKKAKTKNLIWLIAGFVISSFLVGTAVLAATVNTGIEYGTFTGLGTQDLRVGVMQVVRIALGFIGVIAVIIAIYGGFVWMTAAGNAERIDTAKKILRNALIGLVIVLLSFAIASFLISALTDATGGTAPCDPGDSQVCSIGICPGVQICQPSSNWGSCIIDPGCDPNATECRVTDISPESPPDRPLNSVVRVRFNNGNITNEDEIKVYNVDLGDIEVAGSYTVSGNLVEFVPSDFCDAPLDTYNCFEPNTNYRVDVTGGAGVIRCGELNLVCGVDNCTTTFRTGDFVDTQAPTITLIDKQICQGPENELQALVDDDYGVDYVEFRNQILVTTIGVDSNIGQYLPTIASVPWDTSGYPVNSIITVEAEAVDYDANSTVTFPGHNFTIRAGHCCNGVLDGDEEAVDCGGADCESCSPVIEWVWPLDGAPGNLTTIHGRHFRSTPGQVDFSDINGDVVVTAALADSANPLCTDVWSDSEIVAVVPIAAGNGPIQVTDNIGQTNRTDTAPGSPIANFTVNSIIRPGICTLNPAVGEINDPVIVEGINFTPAGNEVYFANAKAGGLPIIVATQIQGVTVPALNNSDVAVRVLDLSSDEFSNPKTFSVGPQAPPPPIFECSSQIGACSPDNDLCDQGFVCNASCLCEPVGELPNIGTPCDFNPSTPICDPNNILCESAGLACDESSCTCQIEAGTPDQSTLFSAFQTGIQPGSCSLDAGVCIADSTLCGQQQICDPISCDCVALPTPQCVDNDTAISFNGTNTYISITPQAGSLDLQGLSYEVWVKPRDTAPGLDTVLSRVDTSGGIGFPVLIQIDSVADQWQVEIRQDNDSLVSQTGSYGFDANYWHHLVLTASQNQVTFYIDGQNVGQWPMPNPGAFDYSLAGDLYIGNAPPTIGDSFFAGSIDDVAIYNRALTNQEASLLYQNQPLTTGSLVSWWRFNEGGGTVVSDSISDNDGTLQGVGSWSIGHFPCAGTVACDLDLNTPICDPDNIKCSELGEDFICEPNSCTCQSIAEPPEDKNPDQSTYFWAFTTTTVGPRVLETCNRTASCDYNTITSPTPFSREGTSKAGYRVSLARPDDGLVPIDSIIGAQFTDLMYEPSLNNGTIVLYDCGLAIGNFDAGTCTTPVSGTLEINRCAYLTELADTSCFNIIPDNLLVQNHWYQVVLDANNILGQNGIALVANETGGDYRWVFKTRDSAELSQVACLYLKPPSSTLYYYDQRQQYSAIPAPAGFTCVEIRPESCSLDGGTTESYNWSIGPGNFGDATAAKIVLPSDPGAVSPHDDISTDHLASAAAQKHTEPDYVQTQALCQTPEGSVPGFSRLTIDFSGPVIIDKWPDCGTACLNAAIGARFDRPMVSGNSGPNAINSVENPLNISLYSCYDNNECLPGYGRCNDGSLCPVAAGIGACNDGSTCNPIHTYDQVPIVPPIYDVENVLRCENSDRLCDNLGPGVDCGGSEGLCVDTGEERYIFNTYPTIEYFNGLLAPDTFYRVVVSGRVASDQELQLLNALNYDNPLDRLEPGDNLLADFDSYSWVFKTQADFNLCLIDHVTVQPASLWSQTDRDWRYGSKPFASPDICDPEFGQRLNPFTYDWGWRTSALSALSGGVNACTAKLCRDSLGKTFGACNVDADCAAGQTCSDQYGFAVGDPWANEIGAGLNWPFERDIDFPYCATGWHPGDREYLRDGCGNGVIDLGEDCDTGRLGEDDGCSDVCLHQPIASAVCGGPNPQLELGEECEDTINGTINLVTGLPCIPGSTDCDDYCDNATCLWNGSVALFGTASVCGNSILEAGEQCDNGDEPNGNNADGCTNTCVLTGTVPGRSLCGDGVIGLGEQCDTGEYLSCLDINFGVGCNVDSDPGCFACRQLNGQWLACTNQSCVDTCQAGPSCRPQNADAGNCSASCLNEPITATGNNNYYQSLCGNGVVERGEDCELPGTLGCNNQCLHPGSIPGSLTDGRVDPYQTVHAGIDGQTYIQAWSTAQTDFVRRGQGYLLVGTGPIEEGEFALIERWPDCSSACIDAAVGGRFNLSADPDTINTSAGVNNILLYSCGSDSRCTNLTSINNIDVIASTFNPALSNDRFDIYLPPDYNPVDNDQNPITPAIPALLPNTWYRVVVFDGSTGVLSAGGQQLANLNYDSDANGLPDAHSWTFKTKNDPTLCGLDSVDVIPEQLILREGNEKYLYRSESKAEPDQCDPNGQRLNPYYFTWIWDDAEITLDPNDTTPPIALINSANLCGNGEDEPGESSFCRALSPSNYDGCGNGVLERGEDCERVVPDFDFPAGCNLSNCLWQGTTAPTCGNGTLDPGEECDDGDVDTTPNGFNGQVPDYCGSNCLWTGNTNRAGSSQVPICGNGIVEDNEQCDFGNEPNGDDTDGCTDSCLFAGSVPGTNALCGDGQISFGEECDNGELTRNESPVSGSDEECTGITGDPNNVLCSNFNSDPATCEQIDTENPSLNYGAWCYWSGNNCLPRPCLNESDAPNRSYQGSIYTGNDNWYISICGNNIRELGEECDDGNFSFGYCSTDGSACEDSSTCGLGVCIADGCSAVCLRNGSTGADNRPDPYQIVETVADLVDGSGNAINPVNLPAVNEEIRAWHQLQPDRVGVGELAVIGSADVPFTVVGHQPPQNADNQCRNVAIWAVTSQSVEKASLEGRCASGAGAGSQAACLSSKECLTDEHCVFDSFRVCEQDCNAYPNLVASLSHEPVFGSCNIDNECSFPSADAVNVPLEGSYCTTNADCIGTRIMVRSLYDVIDTVQTQYRTIEQIFDLTDPIEVGYLDANKTYEVAANDGSLSGKFLQRVDDDIEGSDEDDKLQRCNEADLACRWNFTTNEDFCECDYIGVTIDYSSGGTETNRDWFTCARDNCGQLTPLLTIDDDFDSGVVGNQHQYNAICYDLNNPLDQRIPISTFNIKFEWSELDAGDIIYLTQADNTALGFLDTDNNLSHPDSIYVTPGENGNDLTTVGSPEGKNGKANIKVFANEFFCSTNSLPCDPLSSPQQGEPCPGACERSLSAQQSIAVTNFICDNPWPDVNNFPYEDNDSNGVDPDTNFQLYYCRDDGQVGFGDDLSRMNDQTNIVIGTSADVVKEIIFPFGSSESSTWVNPNDYSTAGRHTSGYWAEDPSCNNTNTYSPPNGCNNVPGLDFVIPANSADNYAVSLTTYNFRNVANTQVSFDLTRREQPDPNLFNPRTDYNGHKISVYLRRADGPNPDPTPAWDAANLVTQVTHRAFDLNNPQSSEIQLGYLEPGSYELAFRWSNDYCSCDGTGGTPQCGGPFSEACDANLFLQRVGIYPAGESGDAVGIRVLENPLHLSPSTWYQSGFCSIPGTKEFSNLCFDNSDCLVLRYCDLNGSGSIDQSVEYGQTCQTDSDCTDANCLPALNVCQFNVPQRGAPQSTVIDGYEAVFEGRTVYVGATNRSNGNLYSNLYLISYNQNADQDTIEIVRRILDREQQQGVWYFNSDVTNNYQICGTTGQFAGTDFTCGPGTTVADPIDQIGSSAFDHCITLTNHDSCEADKSTYGCFWSDQADACLALTCEPIYCESNLDCPDLNCVAPKNELVRDAKRFGDLRDIQISLGGFVNQRGSYPTLGSGSFVASTTFSFWPSWQQTFGNALSALLPTDPINLAVGCPANNPECWSQAQGRFYCPDDALAYAYRSAEDGANYELYTNFEYEGVGTWRSQTEPDLYLLPLEGFDPGLSASCRYLDFEIHEASITGGIVPPTCESDGGDPDADGICENYDNCPALVCDDAPYECYNPDQTDSNSNGLGDVCDSVCTGDIDKDQVCDQNDNCKYIVNRKICLAGSNAGQSCNTVNDCGGSACGQLDTDNDGLGDVCDPCTDFDRDGWWDLDTGANDPRICGKDNAPAFFIGFCENADGQRNGQRCRAFSPNTVDCSAGYTNCVVPFGNSTGISDDHRSYCIVMKGQGLNTTDINNISQLTSVHCGNDPNPVNGQSICDQAVAAGKIKCAEPNGCNDQDVVCQDFENITTTNVAGLNNLITFNPLQEDEDSDQVGYIADDCIDFDKDGFGDWSYFTKSANPNSVLNLTANQRQHFQGCQGLKGALMTPWLGASQCGNGIVEGVELCESLDDLINTRGCSNNPSFNCYTDSQCPGGACVSGINLLQDEVTHIYGQTLSPIEIQSQLDYLIANQCVACYGPGENQQCQSQSLLNCSELDIVAGGVPEIQPTEYMWVSNSYFNTLLQIVAVTGVNNPGCISSPCSVGEIVHEYQICRSTSSPNDFKAVDVRDSVFSPGRDEFYCQAGGNFCSSDADCGSGDVCTTGSIDESDVCDDILGPDWYLAAKNPSRTSVNTESGEAWVAYRDSPGGVALFDGRFSGTLNDPNVPNPLIKFCDANEDINGDGFFGPGSSQVGLDEFAPPGDLSGARGVAIDRNGDAWVGGRFSTSIYKISGQPDIHPDSATAGTRWPGDCHSEVYTDVGHSAYGMSMDANGNLWVVGGRVIVVEPGTSALSYVRDPGFQATVITKVLPVSEGSFYGIGLDFEGNAIVSTGFTPGPIYKVKANLAAGSLDMVPFKYTKDPADYDGFDPADYWYIGRQRRGVGIDIDGNIWTAKIDDWGDNGVCSDNHASCSIGNLSNCETPATAYCETGELSWIEKFNPAEPLNQNALLFTGTAYIPEPDTAPPAASFMDGTANVYAVSGDSAGFLWAVNHNDGNVCRFYQWGKCANGGVDTGQSCNSHVISPDNDLYRGCDVGVCIEATGQPAQFSSGAPPHCVQTGDGSYMYSDFLGLNRALVFRKVVELIPDPNAAGSLSGPLRAFDISIDTPTKLALSNLWNKRWGKILYNKQEESGSQVKVYACFFDQIGQCSSDGSECFNIGGVCGSGGSCTISDGNSKCSTANSNRWIPADLETQITDGTIPINYNSNYNNLSFRQRYLRFKVVLETFAAEAQPTIQDLRISCQVGQCSNDTDRNCSQDSHCNGGSCQNIQFICN